MFSNDQVIYDRNTKKLHVYLGIYWYKNPRRIETATVNSEGLVESPTTGSNFTHLEWRDGNIAPCTILVPLIKTGSKKMELYYIQELAKIQVQIYRGTLKVPSTKKKEFEMKKKLEIAVSTNKMTKKEVINAISKHEEGSIFEGTLFVTSPPLIEMNLPHRSLLLGQIVDTEDGKYLVINIEELPGVYGTVKRVTEYRKRPEVASCTSVGGRTRDKVIMRKI